MRAACPLGCRSSAGRLTSRPCSASVTPTNRPRVGTTGDPRSMRYPMRDHSSLRRQAELLGVELTDEDLASIAQILDKSRASTDPLRPTTTDGLEPSYVFTPVRPRDDRGSQEGTSLPPSS